MIAWSLHRSKALIGGSSGMIGTPVTRTGIR